MDSANMVAPKATAFDSWLMPREQVGGDQSNKERNATTLYSFAAKLCFFLFVCFILALDSKAPKAEDIEEEDDDVPGMQCCMYKKL